MKSHKSFSMNVKVEFSLKTLITIVVFALVLWALFLIKNVIILLFFAFILTSALSPIVTKLERRNLSRGLAVTSVYIVLFSAIGLVSAIIYPLFRDQIINLINNFPTYVNLLSGAVGGSAIQNERFFSTLSQEVSRFSASIFKITLSIFSGVLSFVTVAVLTFYLLLDEKNLKLRLKENLPAAYSERVLNIIYRAQQKLGAWVRGQLVLSLIVGTLYFVGLWILNVDFPLALGLIGGLLEVVPVFGVIIAAVPAVLIALTASPVLALAVIALFFIVQQLENHVIVPKVMQRAVGVSPLVILIALLVGGRLQGIIGILLAVPIVVVGQIVLSDIWGLRNQDNGDDVVEEQEEQKAKEELLPPPKEDTK